MLVKFPVAVPPVIVVPSKFDKFDPRPLLLLLA